MPVSPHPTQGCPSCKRANATRCELSHFALPYPLIHLQSTLCRSCTSLQPFCVPVMGSPLAAVESSGFCASLPFIHHLMVSQLATPAPSTTSIPFCVRKHGISALGQMDHRCDYGKNRKKRQQPELVLENTFQLAGGLTGKQAAKANNEFAASLKSNISSEAQTC